ncbi:MAG: T9SS type A sorting domain-containing protein [Paramuribaculum sp.]|nr:T9SS type A sorting domain-containing protein [Paramuribaculum sp.]
MKRFLAYMLFSAVLGTTGIVASGAASHGGAGVEIVAESVATVTTGVGEMTISTDQTQRFYVFSITGQMIKSLEISAGEQKTIELPNGCYIVKCAQWSKKVVVR